jgi:glycosyltransferase involved in cell wall biosynthesis
MEFNKPIFSHIGKPVQEAKFSILIPSWNNLELLKVCVNSILKNSVYKHQIIIHINQGDDGTLDWVKENKFPYTNSFENVGVCYAMNAMAKLASTDYILYLNDDMYACPDWDSNLIEAIEKQEDEFFYFSATMIEPTSSKNKCVIAPYNFGLTAETFEEKKLLTFEKTAQKEDWYGASWPPSVVHKKLWEKVGGYSLEYSPGFGSDPDFSMKLWKAGVRNFKGIGKSRVYHFQSKSTGRVVKNNGRLTFAIKWGIPSSYFYKNILRLGETYKSEPLHFSKNIAYRIAQLRALWIKLKR